jgi:hypothetical protein
LAASLGPVAAFLGVILYPSATIVNQADEDAMLAASKAAAAAAAAKAIAKVIPKTPKTDEGSTTFYHGGLLAEVTAIVATGLIPVSVNTHKHTPGSFFTHEASQPLALEAASYWPIVSGKTDGAGVGVVAMQVPNSVLRALQAANLARTGFVPGTGPGMPPETVFSPGSFPVLNLKAKFTLVPPSL